LLKSVPAVSRRGSWQAEANRQVK